MTHSPVPGNSYIGTVPETGQCVIGFRQLLVTVLWCYRGLYFIAVSRQCGTSQERINSPRVRCTAISSVTKYSDKFDDRSLSSSFCEFLQETLIRLILYFK